MSDANMLLERAKAALIAHDYSLAAKIYKNLILEEPNKLEYKMGLGNLYVKAGKDDQALTIFKQIEKIDNENIDALVAISGIYRRQKKFEESVAFLEQALIISEGNPQSHAKISYNLGFTYRQMGNYEDAVKCFEEVVEETPNDVLANNHLGAIYAMQGNHQKAIEAYNRGLKYDSNHPILQFNIAKSYAEIGEISKAQSFYEGALRAKPGWTEAIEAYADLLLEENKVSEADEVVTQALKINPDDVKIHTAKGNVYNRQSIYNEAEAEFKKALDSDENYKNALTGLAHSLERQEKYVEAVETISKAEKLNPTDIRIMKQAAHIHISANKLESAYEKILKLQKLIDNDVQTINLLGQYYIRKDDHKKAEECFADIKKINPDYNDLYRDWAERFIQNGDDKKAEPYLQAAIQKNPNDSMAMLELGNLYEKQNYIGKALQLYRKASSADSFNNLSKLASARIMGSEEALSALDSDKAEPPAVDYDSLFSGTRSEDEILAASEADAQNVDDDSLSEIKDQTILDRIDGISENGEISLAENDAGFEDELPEEVTDEETTLAENDGDDFDFDQFGMEKLAQADSGADNVKDVADMLESGENAFDESSVLDFEELTDDGSPIDEEDDIRMAFDSAPDETSFMSEDSSEKESLPAAESGKKQEISEESLDKLEEQIKRAAELAEKANYAAESAWKAASQAADSAQIAGEAKKIDAIYVKEPEEDEEPEPENHEEMEALEAESSESQPELPSEEELNAEEELSDSDLLAAKELLNEDDISEAETEDDDFLDDIPDYLQEDEKEMVAESEETEENRESADSEMTAEENEMETAEKETPKVDDLTLRRAIDMLPSIIAAIEDRSLIYRFRAFLSMFKTLREMLDYLPPEQRQEFMTSRNRLLLDYVISKLSGKPGLYATTKALLRSGLIHENPNVKASEKEGIELVKDVLVDLRNLTDSLEDKTLKDALLKEADSLEGVI